MQFLELFEVHEASHIFEVFEWFLQTNDLYAI